MLLLLLPLSMSLFIWTIEHPSTRQGLDALNINTLTTQVSQYQFCCRERATISTQVLALHPWYKAQ